VNFPDVARHQRWLTEGTAGERPSFSRVNPVRGGRKMNTLLKIAGAILIIWAAFWMIGLVLKAVGWLLVAAAVVTIGFVGYKAVTAGSANRKQIR
jgi:hypothetical protein